MPTNATAGAPRLGRGGFAVVATVAVALATMVAAVLLPALAIQVATWFTGDDTTTAGLAATAAEPLALLGVLLVAAVCALRDVQFLGRKGWLALVAASAVSATVAGALWVGDFDVWTLAAALLIPCAVALTEWAKRRRAR